MIFIDAMGETRVQVPLLQRAWYYSDMACFQSGCCKAPTTEHGSELGGESWVEQSLGLKIPCFDLVIIWRGGTWKFRVRGLVLLEGVRDSEMAIDESDGRLAT